MMVNKNLLERYDKWVSNLPVNVEVSTLSLMKDRVEVALHLSDESIDRDALMGLERHGWKIIRIRMGPSLIVDVGANAVTPTYKEPRQYVPKPTRPRAKSRATRSFARWTASEQKLLLAKRKKGWSYKRIAKELKRSVGSVEQCGWKLTRKPKQAV